MSLFFAQAKNNHFHQRVEKDDDYVDEIDYKTLLSLLLS